MTRESAFGLVACVAVGLWGVNAVRRGSVSEFGAAVMLALLLVFLSESEGV